MVIPLEKVKKKFQWNAFSFSDVTVYLLYTHIHTRTQLYIYVVNKKKKKTLLNRKRCQNEPKMIEDSYKIRTQNTYTDISFVVIYL